MKELRKIDTAKVREMCIDCNYFTAGTNEEYEAMFEMCRAENPTTDKYVEIANVIFWCSNQKKLKEKYGVTGDEIVRNIVFDLINHCTTVYIVD